MGYKNLKKTVLLAILFFLSVSVTVPGIIYAQENNSDAQETVEDNFSQEKIRARVDTYKESAKNDISQSESKRIASVCKDAQVKLQTVKARVDSAASQKKEKLNGLSTKLDVLLQKIKKTSVDTSEIEAIIAQIRSEKELLITTLLDHETTVNDLVLIDCESDPEAFKAALVTAREQRKNLLSQLDTFKSLLKEQLKTNLQSLKSNLANQNNNPNSEE